MDASGILALLGGVAIFVSLFGGGIEIERLKIPVVSWRIRLFSAVVGMALIGVAIWLSNPQLFQISTAPNSTVQKQSESNLTALDDFIEETFNQEKWYLDWFGGSELKYTVEQYGGQACFNFTNETQDYREFLVRSKFSKPIDVFEIDITYVSGNGEFGLDMNDGIDWDNYLINENGRIRIAYSSFGLDKEFEYVVKDKSFENGFHKLSVVYGPYEALFFFDDIQVWSRPVQGELTGYGFDVRMNPKSTLSACVESVRVRFIQ